MDTVRLAMTKARTDDSAVHVVTEDDDGVRTGVTAVPADEWITLRVQVKAHYDLNNSTRVDCINIITALTVALTGR